MQRLTRQTKVSPDYHPVFLFRGDAHFASGNYENAISCLNRFLVVLLEYHWGRLLRGAAHEALGSAQAAREDVSYVRQNALMLTGHYLQQLLHARSSLFKDGAASHQTTMAAVGRREGLSFVSLSEVLGCCGEEESSRAPHGPHSLRRAIFRMRLRVAAARSCIVFHR